MLDSSCGWETLEFPGRRSREQEEAILMHVGSPPGAVITKEVCREEMVISSCLKNAREYHFACIFVRGGHVDKESVQRHCAQVIMRIAAYG